MVQSAPPKAALAPLGPRTDRLLRLLAATLALLAALAFAVDHRLLGDRREVAVAVGAFMAPAQEWLLERLGPAPVPEFVVFLAPGAGEPALRAYFAAHPQQRRLPDVTTPGVLVVATEGAAREALATLRAQPWARLVVRNQGLFFCH